MTRKLLTIAIPTFNRASHLTLLLDTLAAEVRGLEAWIEIVVFDNASEDRTPEVAAAFVSKCPVARVVRHATNIGSAPNFVACFNDAESRYFWLFGDDDAPARGLLSRVVELLSKDAPDLAYLDSKWAKEIAPLLASPTEVELRTRLVDRDAFCRRTHVYLTFISSIIVSKDCIRDQIDPNRLLEDIGSHFVQLSWTLGAIRHGKRFAVIEGACVLATQGNSGGYGLMTVFGVEFPKAVDLMLGRSREAMIIMRRTLVCYLPGLFWDARNGTGGNFKAESPWNCLRQWLGGFVWYWAVILPIGKAYRPMGRMTLTFARAVSFALRKWDRRATA